LVLLQFTVYLGVQRLPGYNKFTKSYGTVDEDLFWD
jgi:hypothetical protein